MKLNIFSRNGLWMVVLAGWLSGTGAGLAGSLGDIYLEAGLGYARFDTGSDKLNMVTTRVAGNYPLFSAGLFGVDLRADYQYANDTDGGVSAHLHQGQIEAVGYANVLGVVKPYVSAGGVYDDAKYPTSTGGVDTSRGGYTLSAGVQVSVVPSMLYLTPSYRYTDTGARDRHTYKLDATLWITYVGVGAYVSYEDFQHEKADWVEAGAYVTFRF